MNESTWLSQEQNYGFLAWDSIGENWYFVMMQCLRISTGMVASLQGVILSKPY